MSSVTVQGPTWAWTLLPFQKPPSTNSAPISWLSCRHASSLLGPNQPIVGRPQHRRRLIISTTLSLLVLVLCLFLPAGTWAWSRGWLFLVVLVVASILVTLYLRRVNPDVIAGRVNRHEGPRRWDLLLGLIASCRR